MEAAVARPECLGGSGLKDLVAEGEETSLTLEGLMNKMGKLELARIAAVVQAEIQRLDGLIEQHMAQAVAKEEHQEELLKVTGEDLRASVAEHMQQLGSRASRQIEALLLSSLRRLPAEYRALSLRDAANYTFPAGVPVAKQPSVASATTTKEVREEAAQLHHELLYDKLRAIQQENDKFDRLKQEIKHTAQQLERIPTEQRRSQIGLLESKCESCVIKTVQPSSGGA